MGGKQLPGLEHVWRFNVEGGESATVNINAWRTRNDKYNRFIFEWSQDGQNWSRLFSVRSEQTTNHQARELPADIEGTVWIRVRDTGARVSGWRSADSLYIDQLMIRVTR